MTDNTKPMFSLESLNTVIKSISIDYEKRIIEKLREYNDGQFVESSIRKPVQYNESYYFILDYLSKRNEPGVCADMARERGVTTQTMGKQIQLMSEHGYVTKAKSEANTRANDISLTNRGHDLIQALVEINVEIENEYRAKMHKGERFRIDVAIDTLEYLASQNNIKLITF